MQDETHDCHRVVTDLSRRAEQGASAARIAEVVTESLGRIESTLGPIIGRGGVVALHRRCLHRVASTHPWLAGSDSSRTEIDLLALATLLGQRDAADAARAGGALLEAICELLASLVGHALGERLLRTVWADFHGAADAKELSA